MVLRTRLLMTSLCIAPMSVRTGWHGTMLYQEGQQQQQQASAYLASCTTLKLHH
jgi:hypothetical protein